MWNNIYIYIHIYARVAIVSYLIAWNRRRRRLCATISVGRRYYCRCFGSPPRVLPGAEPPWNFRIKIPGHVRTSGGRRALQYVAAGIFFSSRRLVPLITYATPSTCTVAVVYSSRAKWGKENRARSTTVRRRRPWRDSVVNELTITWLSPLPTYLYCSHRRCLRTYDACIRSAHYAADERKLFGNHSARMIRSDVGFRPTGRVVSASTVAAVLFVSTYLR